MPLHALRVVSAAVAAAFFAVVPGFPPGTLPHCSAGEPQKPKNVLFLFSDDQRFDTIHALGNEEIRTPVLDRLTEEGFTFTHAFIMGSTHPAVCIPSRAMLMSGRGLWRTPMNLENVQTWPEIFRAHGFYTFGVGKWHNGAPSYARSFEDGGAVFFGGMHDHFAIPIFDFHADGKYPAKDRKIGDKFSSELFAEEAIRFLKTYKGDRPFFAYIAFTAPHDPRTPPGEFARMYGPETVALPPNFMPEHPFDNGELKIRDELLASFPRDPQDIRRQIAEYYGMISHWKLGDAILEWIRQCETTFERRQELRPLLRPDVWPHAGRSSFVTLLRDKAVDTRGLDPEKAVGTRLSFRQPPPLDICTDQFLFYLRSTLAEAAYRAWSSLTPEPVSSLPPERFVFEVHTI